VLVNESELFQTSGVTLRVKPDGTSTLVQTVTATAEVDLDMRLFPFDKQHLVATFEALGFDSHEVVFSVAANAAKPSVDGVALPEWSFTGAKLEVGEHRAPYAGSTGTASSLILGIDAARTSWYARRLVVVPLIMIVLLSFSVFWMDRSSLGDRTSVSFIGILTVVTYQFIINDQLPHIAYFTLMHGFLGFSFVTMCATVVINLAVGTLDKRGEITRGDRVDRYCRWIFPLFYFGLIFAMLGFEMLLT
jgi:hypothetical protein